MIGTEEAWALKELPANLAVVGAGASGTEIASAYVRLGSSVQLFEGLDRVLPNEDADISKAAARGFKKQGIAVHTKTFVSDVQSGESSVTFSFGEEKGEADWLVIATGRGPDVEGLGLDAAGVKLDEGGLIAVDGQMRTNVAKVYAIGDLVHGPALAHKSMEEGVIAVEHAAGLDPASARVRGHPGRDVLQAERRQLRPHRAAGQGRRARRRRRQGPLRRRRRDDRLRRPHRHGQDRRRQEYGEILGAHIIGSKAVDMVQEVLNAKLLEGGYPELARTIHGHPTFSEAVLEAARAADGWLIHG